MMKSLRERWRKTRSGSYRIPPGGYGKAQEKTCFSVSIWRLSLIHIYTEFSDDSVYPMESVVQDAIRMKIDELCSTDHVDYGIKEDWDSGKPIVYRGQDPLANVDTPRYIREIDRMKQKYGGQDVYKRQPLRTFSLSISIKALAKSEAIINILTWRIPRV